MHRACHAKLNDAMQSAHDKTVVDYVTGTTRENAHTPVNVEKSFLERKTLKFTNGRTQVGFIVIVDLGFIFGCLSQDALW